MDLPATLSPTRRNHLTAMLTGRQHGETRNLLDVPIDHIVRNEAQPRTHFDQDAIASLASSIEARGVIQPIAVRPLGHERYEIIAGERRWLAAQRAGLRSFPTIVHDVDSRDALVLALVE